MRSERSATPSSSRLSVDRAAGPAAARLASVAALALALALAGPASAQDLSSLPPEVEARLEVLTRTPVDDGRLDSLTLVVTLGDETVFSAAYGLDGEHGAARVDSLYHVDGLFSRFVAALTLDAIDRDELALDDELGEAFEELADSPAAPITVEQLLTHTCGLPPLEDLLPTTKPRTLTRSRLLEALQESPLLADPGTCSTVSDVNDVLLGWWVSKAAGAPLHELFTTRLFEPADLRETRTEPLGETRVRVHSTAGDLLDWNRSILEGELYSIRAQRRLTTQARIDAATPLGYAYGSSWTRLDEFALQVSAGSTERGSAALGTLPDLELNVVALSGSEDAELGPLVRQVVRAVLNLPVEPGEEVPLPETSARKYLGIYHTGCDRWTVTLEDGQLVLEVGYREPIAFHYRGGDRFGAIDDEEVGVWFAVEGGQVTHFELDDHGVLTRATRSQ